MSRTKDDTWTGPRLSSRVPMNLSNLPLSALKEAAIVPAPVSVEIGKMMALLGIAQATRRKGKGGKGGKGGGGGGGDRGGVWGHSLDLKSPCQGLRDTGVYLAPLAWIYGLAA